MIPAFLAGRNHGSFLNDTELESRHGPVIVPRSEHNVSRANISPNALKVLYRLKSAGFEAFLVGGGVRDLLLDRHPKDFDVVTNADPDQIHDLFRNCRLIGRRFRLAHVRFGRDIVEVATFRAVGRRGRRRRARALRQRPHPARQRLRHDRRGRLAPRLHRQRALLQHHRLQHLGLHQRCRRRACAHVALDRRSREALSRGSGAHAARHAVRGEARFHARARDGGADRRARQTAEGRAVGAAVRRAA